LGRSAAERGLYLKDNPYLHQSDAALSGWWDAGHLQISKPDPNMSGATKNIIKEIEVGEETVIWFGKYGPKDGDPGKDISEIPSGYLRWMIENIDPVPLPKDTKGLSLEQVKAMEDRMRNFLSVCEDELNGRDES